MEDRFTYGLNPEKLGAVSSYLCDPNTAPAEFLLVKVNTLQRQAGPYLAGPCSFRSGRRSCPGRLRRKKQTVSAMKRRCAGQRESISSSSVRIPTRPISTITFISMRRPLTAPRKFHNFIDSSFALRRLSDRVCIEHELSVIQNPCQHSKGRFLHYGQWIGENHPLPSSGYGWLFSRLWRKAHRLCRLSSAHGGVRLFGETGTRRCHLIPCTRAGKTDSAPGFYTGSRI